MSKQAGFSFDESGPPPFSLFETTQPPVLVARQRYRPWEDGAGGQRSSPRVRFAKARSLFISEFEEVQANGSPERREVGPERPSVVGVENAPRLDVSDRPFDRGAQAQCHVDEPVRAAGGFAAAGCGA